MGEIDCAAQKYEIIKNHADVSSSAVHLIEMGQQSRHMALGCHDNVVRVVYYPNMQLKYQIKVNYQEIMAMYFTPNENYIIVVGDSNLVTFVSHVDKCIEMTMPVETEHLSALDLSYDGDQMIVVGESKNLTVIDLKSQKSITTMLFFDISKKITALASPDAYKIPPFMRDIMNEKIQNIIKRKGQFDMDFLLFCAIT